MIFKLLKLNIEANWGTSAKGAIPRNHWKNQGFESTQKEAEIKFWNKGLQSNTRDKSVKWRVEKIGKSRWKFHGLRSFIPLIPCTLTPPVPVQKFRRHSIKGGFFNIFFLPKH
jgi:hypothetical protein